MNTHYEIDYIINFQNKNYFLNRQKIYEDIDNKNCPLTREFYKLINNLRKNSYEDK